MNYQQSLDYIYSFADLGLKAKGRSYDLSRMRALLARLGDPQRAVPAAHVAGTKGKGSTSALIASVMRAAGYRVGLYTSPHLHETYERIRLNGESISSEDFASLTTELRPHFESFSGTTTFEMLTAMAFAWFARQRCNFMVIEVGLGGRLDATNTLLPNVCAITSISFDHTHVLGNTLAKIASEKSGIIKAGAPVVTSPQPPEAEEAIAAAALDRGSHLVRVGIDWRYYREKFSLESQSFNAWKINHPPLHFDLPLLGEHQVENAVTAIAMVDELRQQGFKISDEALHEGIANVKWAGRFEVFNFPKVHNLREAKAIVLDCAHNRDSMRRLVLAFNELFPKVTPTLIFGVSDDKDVSGMLSELVALAIEKLIVVKANHPHASDPAKLAVQIESSGVARSVKVAHTISEALDDAKRKAEVILVTGSIFVVADVRAELKF
ncbi:MAG: bifunctional folylpolyglutamate synthase/dihydrofolate synthase [Chloroflexi bacterium]|nr:bifunctional folylpolyglutamate synthase/dihydrofolate synthase [Chloroflexota bacterium]